MNGNPSATAKKILHIAYWYPTKEDPRDGLFIQRHIDSLKQHYDCDIAHIMIREGKPFKYERYRDDFGVERFILSVPIKRMFFIEILITFMLTSFLISIRKQQYSLVNFHIAYPLLTYYRFWKKLLPYPICINEHWSAYHENFSVSDTSKLGRAKRIFSHGIPVISVSQSLDQDIKSFSGYSNYSSRILPNVIDTEHFYPTSKEQSLDAYTIFSVANWKAPKRADVLIKAFAKLVAKQPKIRLRLGGYRLEPLKKLVAKLGIQESVDFLGPLLPDQIAEEMRVSSIFALCSDYETFSVVCAEAAATGTPVLASNVGGIQEFINEENGVLVAENTMEKWFQGLENILSKLTQYTPKQVADSVSEKFSPESIGQQYANILQNLIDLPTGEN